MFPSKNIEDIPAEELILLDDEHDPVLIQFRKLKEIARRNCEGRVAVKAPESLPDLTPLSVASLLAIPNEYDPFLIKMQKMKKLTRECCDRWSETPRESSESADSDTFSRSSESPSSSSFSSSTSEATVYDTFTTEDEAKSSEATATIGWQTSPQAKRDENIPAFCQPIPTTQWLGRPWRDGCHPSVHRQQ
ncbi:hypothetical protein ACHAP5_007265 [Fusarium lateritium]